ncbi:hypothetical protein SAMD00019534_079530, partial [Acytostelium subglobosum LB1]|uniref:hypothetical protein n=1 Tax=Acytostelium subglobosum LB1 TaxID=1410327 RepID=UPI000644A410
MAVIVCPECSQDYEKEAKYCYKCRLAFTDDLPESIKKYLRPRAMQATSGGGGIGQRSHTVPLSSSSAMTDKSMLQRNASQPVPIYNSKSHSSGNINLTGGVGSNLISSSSPPSINHMANINNTTSSSKMTTPVQPTTTPNKKQPPHVPSHPLPAVPHRPHANSAPTQPTQQHQTTQSQTQSTSPPLPVNNTPASHHRQPPPPPSTTPPQTAEEAAPPSRRPLSRRIPPPPPGKKLVRAVWDCIPEQEGDLEFYVGDIISVTTKDDESGWWIGTLNGRSGLFPRNYVEEYEV